MVVINGKGLHCVFCFYDVRTSTTKTPNPDFNSRIDKNDQTIKEPRACSSPHLFEDLCAKILHAFLNSIENKIA